MKKTAEIKFTEVEEYDIIPHVHTAKTRISVKHNDTITIYGDIYCGERQELESFMNSLKALPELIDAVQYYLALDRSKVVGNEELKRVHQLAKERFCTVLEKVYNGK